jgi:hypothetical protein
VLASRLLGLNGQCGMPDQTRISLRSRSEALPLWMSLSSVIRAAAVRSFHWPVMTMSRELMLGGRMSQRGFRGTSDVVRQNWLVRGCEEQPVCSQARLLQRHEVVK